MSNYDNGFGADKADFEKLVNENSEFHYKTLYEKSISGIGVATLEGDIIDCNPALVKMLGFSTLKELQKHKLIEFYVDLKDQKKILSELKSKGFIIEYKFKVKQKTGKILTALVNANVVSTKFGKLVVVNFLDISEQEKSSEKLAESEKYLDLILNSVNSGVMLIDPETHVIVDANKSALKMLNYKKNEVIGKECFQFICLTEKGKCPVTDLHKKVEDSVRELITKDGELRYILKNVKEIRINEKPFLLETFADIHKQKIAEHELKNLNEQLEQRIQNRTKELSDSEEKFRSLSDLSPSGISIQRGNKYFYVNKAWADITGYDLNEINKVGPYDIIHPDMLEFAKNKSDNNLQKEGAKTRYDIKILTKDKTEKWLDLSLVTYNYMGQNATLAISNDVTEEYIIQENLRVSEEKYRGLIENLKYEYFFYRHNIKGIFEYVSPSVKNILGYSQEEFLTHYSKYLTDNPINIQADKKTQLSIKGERQEPYELEIYDSNMKIHILLVSESPLFNANNEVIAVEGIVHDVTSYKEAEETINKQLEEIKVQNEEIKSINEELHAVNDDLEDRIGEINKLNEELKISEKKLLNSNNQKDKFFSLLAHDLRSPVGNFLQISELLKFQYEELSKEHINEFFDNLHQLADKTFKLLDNLLMWSRSQLGTLEIDKKELELHNVVEEVIFLFEENLKRKNIRCINSLPINLNVIADLNILQTLFRNIISNAIKFTKSSGIITISCNQETDKTNNKKYYIISIQDTGVGIPEDKIETIFNMNEEYTTLGTNNEKGTGLGLTLCKDLIEKCGERMWVGSKLENLPAGRQGGTTFYFTLSY